MLRTICSAFLLLSLCGVVFAQQESLKVTQASATPLITAGSSSERVRFAATSNVVQMRLQVYADNGLIVFDTTSKGNVLDWTVQDGSGERLRTGSYLCVVTVKSLNGKLGQRIGEASIEERRTELRVVDPTRLTAAQQREIGPIEDDATIFVLADNEAEAATIIAHNGEEGQIIRGRGALSFRMGDFFSGKDREQMRLTPEGNLGIGLTNPAVRLDVDGLIRASQGIVFPDGSIQYSASRKTLGVPSIAPGQSQSKHAQGEDFRTAAIDVSGTGTTGKIPKWLDGPTGALNDSNISEVFGAIGINGAPNTSFRLDVNGGTRIRGSNPGFNLEGLSAGGNIWLFQTVDADGRFRLFGQDNTNPGIERLTISLSSGNVGIGATAPAAKLDVAGNINTSTQYNIGGSRVFSVISGSTIAGRNAGTANAGSNNSFFGSTAGLSNTTGSSNSFFGESTGRNNTTASNNSSFGRNAGLASTTGAGNSIFGAQAGQRNTTGADNSFVGFLAGFENTASFNSFFGSNAGRENTTGTNNSFFGNVAGENNTTGDSNSFFGDGAGELNTTGAANSFFGTGAGILNSTGAGNIIIGNSAGISLESGNNNIYLAADAAAAAESNTIRIGTQGVQTSTLIAGISGATSASGATVLVNSSGKLGTMTSSRRYKQDIRDIGNISVRLMQLRPVTFLYRPEYVGGDRTLQYGLIAEEVAKVYPELVAYAADGKPQTVRYHLLPTMLLNEVQKQKRHIQSQEHQLATQSQQMTRQAQQISALETRLRRLETGPSRRQRAPRK